MKPFRGNIARRIVFAYASLALIIVLVSAGSIAGVRYAHQRIIVEALRQQEAALLSARIRSETLLLTNAIQQYVIAAEDKEARRLAIDGQIAVLKDLMQQATDAADPDDVEESIAIGSIRQYTTTFEVQSRIVLDISDREKGYGAETRRQTDILLNHYQPALIQSLKVFEKLKHDSAEASYAQAARYSKQIAVSLSLLSLTAIVLAIAMSFWLVKRFANPLAALIEGIRTLSSSSASAPIPVAADDELGALADALNRMKAEINESRQKLEQYATTLESQVEERTRELRLLAITDPLTGVYNRGHFFALAEKLFAEAERLDQPFSVVIFDFDHFKKINDQYGHAMGDQALKQATQIIQAHIRQMDVLGRYGGEEFVVALPTARLEEAMQIAQRIAAAIRTIRLEHNGRDFRVTLSGGVAERVIAAKDGLENVLLKADKALYQAKERGRDLIIAHQSSFEL